MEILLLDSMLREIDVVDIFTSVIWTERFSTKGDFELIVLATADNRRRFNTDGLLMIRESKRIMRIQTVESGIDDEDRRVLKIKGDELVSILEGRNALQNVLDVGVVASWVITQMKPADIMRHMVKTICVDRVMSVHDGIPFLEWGATLYTTNTIPEPPELIDWEQKPDSVYAAIAELADIYDLGFRLYKDPAASKLYFDVYAGSDRTTAQTTLSPVIFSPDMENLQNTTEFDDVSKHSNVVKVLYTRTVRVPGEEGEEETEYEETFSVEVVDNQLLPPAGFDRKAKVLVVSSIPEDMPDEEISTFLDRAGRDELMKSRPVSAFDGEISPMSQYGYERDYFLGDLVEIRSDNGATAYMRVEEYIHTEDEQGYRSYPTLVTKTFIDSGTWMSWKYDVAWSDMADGETWANQ